MHVLGIGCLVVGQRLDASLRQVVLGIGQDLRKRLAVAGLGVGDLAKRFSSLLNNPVEIGLYGISG
jgi:hypothetical protein